MRKMIVVSVVVIVCAYAEGGSFNFSQEIADNAIEFIGIPQMNVMFAIGEFVISVKQESLCHNVRSKFESSTEEIVQHFTLSISVFSSETVHVRGR